MMGLIMGLAVNTASLNKFILSEDQAKYVKACTLDLFAEQEYSTVTINHIAERAGVTNTLVKSHFDSMA